MVRRFNPKSAHPVRAVQAWQILVAAAMNRQTITYLGLSQQMYEKAAAGVLDKILGHIAYYCNENKLPPLTAIVVGKGRGIPGRDIPVDRTKVDRLRESVYGFKWYNVVPPSPEELKAAFDSNFKGRRPK
jgi:hypothetical protein